MPPSPYIIAGQLPWGGGGAAMFGGLGGLASGNGLTDAAGALAAHYAQAYNSSLAQNQALYNNILAGYQQAMSGQMGGEAGIARGYGRLQKNVLGDIRGIGDSQRQAIADAYAAQQGAQQQALVGAGLGNTTVTSSVGRGLTLDEQKAQVALANQLAQLTAGYRSQLGLASLGYQNQALMQNSALAGQQLNWMNTVQAAYPDAGAYGQLAQMVGQLAQSQRDRSFGEGIVGRAETMMRQNTLMPSAETMRGYSSAYETLKNAGAILGSAGPSGGPGMFGQPTPTAPTTGVHNLGGGGVGGYDPFTYLGAGNNPYGSGSLLTTGGGSTGPYGMGTGGGFAFGGASAPAGMGGGFNFGSGNWLQNYLAGAASGVVGGMGF